MGAGWFRLVKVGWVRSIWSSGVSLVVGRSSISLSVGSGLMSSWLLVWCACCGSKGMGCPVQFWVGEFFYFLFLFFF